MDNPMTWLIIILVVLVIAAGAWMLLRRPGSGSEGGRHEAPVVDRDSDSDSDRARTATGEDATDTATGTPPAGAAPTTPTAQEGSGEAPFDQEATYTDTASGTERPAEQDPHTANLSEPGDEHREPDHPGGASEGTDVGHPGPSQHRGEASYVEEPLAPPEPDAPEGHPGRDSQRVGPSDEPADTTQDEGHPGPESQPPGGATALGETEGHPGRESQAPVTEEAPAPDQPGHAPHETPTEPVYPAERAGTAGTQEPRTEAVPPPQPYGPGSAAPAPDGSGPAGWEIKGNTGSMLFHTPDSPSYEGTMAEVWFESEEAARAAGFAHWDRKRR